MSLYEQPIDNRRIPIIEVKRSNYLDWIRHRWPDKDALQGLVVDLVSNFRRKCPAVPEGPYMSFLVGLGRRIESAEKPEDLVEELFRAFRYFALPEPGWEGAELKILE